MPLHNDTLPLHPNDRSIIDAAAAHLAANPETHRGTIEHAIGWLVLARAGAPAADPQAQSRRLRVLRHFGADTIALALTVPSRKRHRGVVGKRSSGSVRAALALP